MERGSGVVGASQVHYFFSPIDRVKRPAVDRRLCLWHHGAGGETSFLDPVFKSSRQNLQAFVRALVAANYCVLAADFGGAHTWGNDTAMGWMTDAVDWAGTVGCRTDKVALLGESMGALNCYNYAHRHRAGNADGIEIACVQVTIPACDGNEVYAESGVSVQMDAAYPVGGWAGNDTERDPLQLAAADPITVPWVGYYATDDVTVNGPKAATLAALLPQGSAIAGTGGHTDAAYAGITPAAYVAFVDAGDW